MKVFFRLPGVIAALTAAQFSLAAQPIEFHVGDVLYNFRTTTIYTDAAERTVGYRFTDERTDFTLDLFNIESAPQAFIWVKSIPKGDKGEPHACEHLMLGKGNVGRAAAVYEEMTLGNSSAYTDQLHTCYHFNTIAGPEAFYELFRVKLNALVNPDFTDEEIRREVAHIGIVTNPDGALWVDEKGTVYTEMVSSYEKPWSYLTEPMDEMLYGPDHPAANISGGRPDAIRRMIPSDMREFVRETYHLANMGAIVSIPTSIDLRECLRKLADALSFVQNRADHSDAPGIMIRDLPHPEPTAAIGSIVIGGYPSDNPTDPGSMLFAWPPRLEFGLEEEITLDLFLNALAAGYSSLLYQDLFNSTTRKLDLGPGFVYSYASRTLGRPIYVSLGGLHNANINDSTIRRVRELIIGRIQSVKNYTPKSNELEDFNRRVLALLSQRRRWSLRLLDTPPQFGDRGGPAGRWMRVLEGLENESGERKSLVMNDVYDHIEAHLKREGNIWSDLIDRWKLLDGEPYAVAVKPSDIMLQKMRVEKEERLAEAVAALRKKYGLADAQAALKQYQAEFDSTTAALDALQAGASFPSFIDNPPMNLDPDLDFKTIKLGEFDCAAATFEGLTSATVGLVFSLRAIPDSLLFCVPILPSLLTQIGVAVGSEEISTEEMETRLRSEVQTFGAYFSNDVDTRRTALIIKASGSNQNESIRGVEWMEAALTHPLINESNLPRILDVISSSLVGLRNTMKGAEEGWVDYPHNAYMMQIDPCFLAADCYLTQEHYLLRLRWLLTDAGDVESQKALSEYLAFLRSAGKGETRAELTALLADATHSPQIGRAKSIAAEAANDLGAALADIPDDNLEGDWDYLLDIAARDLMTPPAATIDKLKAAVRLLTASDNARCFIISNRLSRNALAAPLKRLHSRLPKQRTNLNIGHQTPGVILMHLRERHPNANPVFVGLVTEDTRNGVIQFSVKLHQPYEATDDAVFDALTGGLFAGAGAHGFFMQTWNAGLAYSNGFRYRERSGMARYYAERCPNVAETMKFVVDILNKTPVDDAWSEYATAMAFSYSRAADTYESRGEVAALDYFDGRSPDEVRRFRAKALKLRRDPHLMSELKSRMGKVYGSVLIGYGGMHQEGRPGTFFLIGSEEQFINLESLIAQTEKPEKVWRLYPRDFWITY